jgi:hypothetical protein
VSDINEEIAEWMGYELGEHDNICIGLMSNRARVVVDLFTESLDSCALFEAKILKTDLWYIYCSYLVGVDPNEHMPLEDVDWQSLIAKSLERTSAQRCEAWKKTIEGEQS